MEFFETLLNGLSLGGTYALIALGYTMVYGIAKLLNFAHGDIIMVGGYALFITLSIGTNSIFALAVAVVVCIVLGVTIEKVAYKPLRGASPLAVLITAIGVSYLLQSLAQMAFGTDPKMPALPELGMIKFEGMTVRVDTIIALVSSIILVILALTIISLCLFVKHTKRGQAMIAVSDDKKSVRLKGIDFNRFIKITFVIGLILVALVVCFILMLALHGVDVIKLEGMTVRVDTIIALVSSIIIMLALSLFVKYTKTGRAMIAVSEDKSAAQLMGINVNRIITITFAIGSALAAVAGYFMLMKAPSLTNTLGAMPGIKAFTAAVIGGIGSIPGAMVGGILMGVVEAFSLSIEGIAVYTDAIEFIILIIILLVRPSGILGKMRREKV